MRTFRTTLVALAVFVSVPPEIRAQQNLALSLFERLLDQFRQESGIPALSAVIVQDRQVVWARGFGMADVERQVAATPDTPYVVGDITQTLAATLLLRRVEWGRLELNDRIQRWAPQFPETSATVGQVLRHTTTGTYRYDPERFAAIEPVIEYYARPMTFRKVLSDEILERLSMLSSAPGADLAQSASEAPAFDSNDLDRYRGVLRQLAVPYRVDLQRRAIRTDYPTRRLTADGGLISSARDLARFDAALDDHVLLGDTTLGAMRQRGGATVPTGLGWFVQPYNNDTLVWHFGNIPNAFSSLILKVPQRELTLILLANSDGLSAPFALEQGDVTRSLYARLFLRTFVP